MATLYDAILEVSREYLGVAAKDYIDRRIRIVQRGEEPETVTVDRLERLAAGIGMTAKVYINADKVDRFQAEILALEKRFQPDT